MLTIRDESGRGKSQLLKQLRYKCLYAEPRIPTSLVALDEMQQKSPYALVTTVEKALRDFDLEFKQFREVENQRIDRRMSGLSSVTGTADIEKQVSGKAGGVIFEKEVTFNQGETPDLIERLRERAVDAFVEDLRCVCNGGRPVVLLFDAYEKCGAELEEWIPGFMQKHVVAAESAVDRLLVVIAGRQVPVARLRLMLGHRFEDVVSKVESLSRFDDEHVRSLLDSHGVKGYGDNDVSYVRDKLNEGKPIGRIVALIREFLRDAGEPG